MFVLTAIAPAQPTYNRAMLNRLLKRFVSLLALSASVASVASVVSVAHVAYAADPLPSQIAARAWVLLDTQSGQLITGYKHDERFEPASLTKLMTAYLVFDALSKKNSSRIRSSRCRTAREKRPAHACSSRSIFPSP